MLSNIRNAGSVIGNYFPETNNTLKKTDDPASLPRNQSSSAERRVYLQGSAAWLNQQALRNNQTGEQPLLCRTLSTPPTPTAVDTPHALTGFPEWSAQRMRKGPDLDALYGSVQPPRAKPGRISGIQKAERKEDGMVIVHPGRTVLNPRLTPELPAILNEVRRELQDGAVYKWNISRNGELFIGKSKHPGGEKLGWGHPTLVGGLKEPEARMGGELRFGKLGKDDSEPVFYINNDSGRYSEYEDRVPEMLENVAKRFKELGFPVEMQWVDKPKVPLRNPKVQAGTESSSHTTAQVPIHESCRQYGETGSMFSSLKGVADDAS